MSEKRIKSGLGAAALAVVSALSACDGGSIPADDIDTTVRDETLEEHIFRFSPLREDDTVYVGDFAPIDIEATAAAHGMALTEVNSIPRVKEYEWLPAVAGHRVYLSDGSFIDNGCWLTSVTFAEGGRMQGSFWLKPVRRAGQYFERSQTNTVTSFIDREEYNRLVMWFRGADYAGIDMGDIANPDFAGLPSVHISHTDHVNKNPPYVEVGRRIGALTTLKVERIVRFAPYSINPVGDEIRGDGCHDLSFYWDPALIKPLPSFNQSGPSWSVASPYQCYLYRNREAYRGTDVQIRALPRETENVCEIWAAEKGW